MNIHYKFCLRVGRLICAVGIGMLVACGEGESLQFSPVVTDNTTDSATGTAPGAQDSNSQSQNIATVSDDPTINASVTVPVVDEGWLLGNPSLITEVVLVTGQSNALGVDPSFDPNLDAPHPRAYAFTENGWRIAELHQVWDIEWHARNNPAVEPTNNFGFHFARKVAARRPDRIVGIILVTFPGAAIEEWDYESEFYVNIRDRVVTALNELPGKATIDGILWHQGETDWLDNDYYTSKLSDLIRNFRGESWFGENKPFICGETVEAPVNNRLMALNNDGDPWTGCVSSDDLPTTRDGQHFSAEGLRIIGTRYATKYIQITEQP